MTQSQMILDHMRTFGEITPLDAMREYGIMRLSARISDLKDDGYVIESDRRTNKNRFGKNVSYAVYTLKKDKGD